MISSSSACIRARHDAYYAEVFEELAARLEVEIIWSHVARDCSIYSTQDQPWFQCMLGESSFVVGPRADITVIYIEAPTGLHTDEIRAAAEAAEATYEQMRMIPNDPSIAKQVTVHARNREELLHFLTILGRASLLVPA